MAIERNYSALRLIEPIAEEIIALKEGEERDGQPIGRLHYTLRLNTLGPIHIGAIARLYGDAGDEVVHHLSRNPVAVLPIVYNRMNEKNTEWRRVRTELNKQWKVAAAENFEGSLDVVCYTKKRELEYKLKFDNLREVSYAESFTGYTRIMSGAHLTHIFFYEFIQQECRRAKYFFNLSQRQKPLVSGHDDGTSAKFLIKSVNTEYALYQPHLAVRLGNDMPHSDAHNLLSRQISKIAKSPSDRFKASRLWVELMVPLLGLPSHWFLRDVQERLHFEPCQAVAVCKLAYLYVIKLFYFYQFALIQTLYCAETSTVALITVIIIDKVGQKVRTFYGIGTIEDVKLHVPASIREPYFCTVRLSYGVAYLRSSFILHTIPAAVSPSSEKNFVRSHKGNFEAIEEKLDVQDSVSVKSCFTFFGTEKVYLFLRLYAALVGILAEGYEYFTSLDGASPTTSCTSGVTKDDNDPIKWPGIADVSRPGNQYNKGYSGLLCALNDFMSGRLMYKAFESACRTLSLKLVFKFVTLPKILKKCAHELLKVVDEDAYLSLLDYARIPQLDISLLRDMCLRSTNGDAAYRIQYDPTAKSLMCCYLPKDTTMIVTAPPSSHVAASADGSVDYVDDADGEHEEMVEDDTTMDDRDGFSGEESDAQRLKHENSEEGQINDHLEDAPLSKRAKTK